MTYSQFTQKAFPAAALAALFCAGWALHVKAPARSAIPMTTPAQSSAPALEPPPPEVPMATALPAPTTAPAPFPPAGAVLTATPGPGPESPAPPTEPVHGKAWLSEFDRALDREFSRMEAREKTSRDPVELAVVGKLKSKLLELDELWLRADQAATAEAKASLQQEAQQTMGEIIQLGRADRNQRLTQIARAVGLADGTAIARFIEDVDRAIVETHLDWAPLFNRGAETPTGETTR